MSQENKIKYLEGLRGLGAFVVVLSHLVVAFYPALYTANLDQIHTSTGIEIIIGKSPLNILYGGNFAVCIFFVLSGYVLSYYYINVGSEKRLKASALKRYFRLVMPIGFSIMLSYSMMKSGLYFNQIVAPITKSEWWLGTFWIFEPSLWGAIKDIVWNVFMNGEWKYNNVLWTMAYEFKGSFIVFLVCFIVPSLKDRKWVYFALVLFFIKTYYVAFILGLILCDYETAIIRGISEQYRHHFSRVLLILSLFMGSYPPGIPYDQLSKIYQFIPYFGIETMKYYHILGAVCLIIAIMASEALKKILSHRVLLFLGRISFSLYLLHILVIGSVGCKLFLFLIVNHSYSYAVTLTAIGVLVVTVAIATGMTIFMDEPSNKRLSRWAYKLVKDHEE